VITLIVHTRDGSIQTAVNHKIVTEERLIRWLSGVFTRADRQPQALVVVGSAGDLDGIMPTLEDALAVPVFAPAEAQLALARGAALASTQHAEVGFTGHFTEHFTGDVPRGRHQEDRRRRPLTQAGPMAMLVAGTLTFVVSVSVAVSMQLAPKKDSGLSEPRPAANTHPETPAAVQHLAPVLPPPVSIPAPVAEAAPPEAPPVEMAPPPLDVPVEPPVSVPEAPAVVSDAVPVEGVPPAASAAPALPAPVAPGAPAPGQVAPMPVEPQPVERRGIWTRIKDRLSGAGSNDAQQAPELAPPPEPVPPPPDAPPLLPPP